MGINVATLTPEMLLYIARVVQCGDQLVVAQMVEDGAGEAAFGGLVADEEDGRTLSERVGKLACRKRKSRGAP